MLKRTGLLLHRTWHVGLMLMLLTLTAVPALAQQQGGGTTQGSDVSVTTSETMSTESWVSDWRIWALVGVVLLVVLVIALTRGRGESSTTVVK